MALALKKKLTNINWFLFLILFTAAFLRFYHLRDYLTFLGDEGRDVLVVKRILVDRKLTLLGPTASVGGFFLGPLYYYMILPFLWLFRLDPVGPAVMVAVLGVLTVWLVWLTGQSFFGSAVGRTASFFYAVSPLVVRYSRSSWNPNVMPFFALLIVYLSWWTVVRKRWRYVFWVGLLFGLTFQIHYLAAFLLVAMSVYFLRFMPWRSYRRRYLEMTVGFGIGWSPFLAFEIRHSFPNFLSFLNFFLRGEETGFVPGRFLPTVFNVTQRLFTCLLAPGQGWLGLVLGGLALYFFTSSWREAKVHKQLFKTFTLLGIWLFLGVGLFGFYQESIYDYYFGFMFPLPFFLTSFSFKKLAQKNQLGRLVACLLGGLIVFVSWQAMYFQKEPNHQVEQTQKITQMIIDQSQEKPFNFALITGQNSDHAYRYFLEIWGKKPVTIENLQVDPERKSVTDQLLVVCEVENCQPLGHPLWEIAGFGQAEIAGEWTVPGGVKVMKLVHYLDHE